jgi:hypothetical protein
MTRWATLFGAAVALAVATGQGSQGQGRQRGPLTPIDGPIRGDLNLANLLGNLGVQTELKLTDEQKAKANAFAREQLGAVPAPGKSRGARAGKADDGGRRGPPDVANRPQQGSSFWEIRSEKALAANQATRAFAKDHLQPEQLARLEGIYYQHDTLKALALDETLQAKLAVTPEQKAEFRALAMNRLRDANGASFDKAPLKTVRSKIDEVEAQYRDKALALLTDDQKKTWADVVGAPFTLQRPGGGRPGGGEE